MISKKFVLGGFFVLVIFVFLQILHLQTTNETNEYKINSNQTLIKKEVKKEVKKEEVKKEEVKKEVKKEEIKEEVLDETSKSFKMKMKEILDKDYPRSKYLKERRRKEDEIISKRNPKPRTEPIIINILCGRCRWGHLDFFDPSWVSGCSVPCKITHGDENDKVNLFLQLENTGYATEMRKKYPNSKYGMFALESVSEHVCGFHLNIEEYKKCMENVDVISTFSLDSDIPMNYAYGLIVSDNYITNSLGKDDIIGLFSNLKKSPNIEIKNALASSWITNCGAKYRTEYLSELSKLMPIHHYGSCLNNGFSGRVNKVLQQEKYKFSFAFENTYESDYVSEKYYQGLYSNNILIYMGAPNIDEYSPVRTEKVFINALKYTPKQLAEVLKIIDKNETMFMEYFKWRSKPLSPSFIDIAVHSFTNRGKNSWLCRACEYYHKRFD